MSLQPSDASKLHQVPKSNWIMIAGRKEQSLEPLHVYIYVDICYIYIYIYSHMYDVYDV